MDSVCADHCFTYIGYGSDHDGSGSDHGTSGSDHACITSATPTTRRPLPHYKGKQIDNTNLLDSIDRVGTKLAETLALVSAIQSQPNEQVVTSHNRSTRPAQASHPARLGTDLVVISTPKGRSAHRRPTSVMGLRLSECEASMENYQA